MKCACLACEDNDRYCMGMKIIFRNPGPPLAGPARAWSQLHHQQVDTGTSGCIDPFGSTPTRSPIHLAPRRLLLDDLHTTCWVLHAAQSLTSKSWVPISILSMSHTWRFSQLFPLVILGSEPVSDRYRATAPYRCRSVSDLWRKSTALQSGCHTAPGRARMKKC